MIIKIIILNVLLSVWLFSSDYYTYKVFKNKEFQALLRDEITSGELCEGFESLYQCLDVDSEYLKIETPLLKNILLEGGYKTPSKSTFEKVLKDKFNISIEKRISTLEEVHNPDTHNGKVIYSKNIDYGADIIILRDEKFITLAYRIPEIIDIRKVSKEFKSLAIKERHKKRGLNYKWKFDIKYIASNVEFLVALNKYLFNQDSTQLSILLKNHYFMLNNIGTKFLKCLLKDASLENIALFIKLSKKDTYSATLQEVLKFLNYKIVHINEFPNNSLYTFCKATGIKESEIRKLNPWINKDATNISVDAEIVVPISSKVEK